MNVSSEPIWHSPFSPDDLNEHSKGCMVEYIGINYTEVGADYIKAEMDVDHRTIQPMGILHGGASVVLAETLGSVAGNRCLNQDTHMAVGLSINASHMRAMPLGTTVYGHVESIHLGRSTQVWQITISDKENRPVCSSRLTLAVLPKRG